MRFRLSSWTAVAVLALVGSAGAQEKAGECPECRCERGAPRALAADFAVSEPLLAVALPGGEDEKLAEKILAEVDKRIRRSHEQLLREFRRMLDERLGRGPETGRTPRAARSPEPPRPPHPPRLQVRPLEKGDRHEPEGGHARAHTYVLERDGHGGSGKARVRIEADGKVIEKEIPFHGGRGDHGEKGGGMEFELPGGKGKVYLNLDHDLRHDLQREGGKDGPRVFSRAWALPGKDRPGMRLLEFGERDLHGLGKHLRDAAPEIEKWVRDFGEGEGLPRMRKLLEGNEDDLRGAGKRLEDLHDRLQRLLRDSGGEERRKPAKKPSSKKSRRDSGENGREGEEREEREGEERDGSHDF
ncbi:MAG: hypothetical protein L0216_04560 [Planctomycetales bacterium]|nr:hypothetical protein [Planctomycetales bacterium]